MHLTFMACIVAMFGSESAEIVRQEGGPECPRFDYEYKVIQRLVRLEDKCEFFERHRGDMENKLAELEIIVEDQRKEIESLKTKQDQPSVIAEMQQPAKQSLSIGQRLFFTTVVHNIGNAYDIHLGQFTAPTDGTYLFSVKICMQSRSYLDYAVIKDGKVVEECFAGNEEWYICGSCTAATYLFTKEKVWVKILGMHSSGGLLGGKTHGTSSFTGVLLNTFKTK